MSPATSGARQADLKYQAESRSILKDAIVRSMTRGSESVICVYSNLPSRHSDGALF